MTLALQQIGSRGSARGQTFRERSLLTPDAINLHDGVWWDGDDLATGTTVTITGSQTITETPSLNPLLAVTSIASISSSDINSVLFSRTITTGQKWRSRVRINGQLDVFLMAHVVFTDGVISTSNAFGALRYVNTSGGTHIATAQHGTLTSMGGGVGVTTIATQVVQDATFITEIEYTSANTFAARYFDESYELLLETTGVAKTMTPTHVGVAWTNWGEAPTPAEVYFGPIYRAA